MSKTKIMFSISGLIVALAGSLFAGIRLSDSKQEKKEAMDAKKITVSNQHVARDMLLEQHGKMINCNVNEIKVNREGIADHESRLDSGEQMRQVINASQQRIEGKVDKQSDYIMKLVEQSAETSAYLKTIDSIK